MPLPLPQTLSLTHQFRERLPAPLRSEFDQLYASLQAQVPGIGVTRHCDRSEILVTGGTNTGGVTGRVVLSQDPTFTHLSYSLLLRELLVVNFYMIGATLTGGPNFLRVKIPGGYKCKSGELVVVGGASISDAGVNIGGRIIASSGVFPRFVTEDTLNFARYDGAAFTAGNVAAQGQIIVPIESVPVVA